MFWLIFCFNWLSPIWDVSVQNSRNYFTEFKLNPRFKYHLVTVFYPSLTSIGAAHPLLADAVHVKHKMQ